MLRSSCAVNPDQPTAINLELILAAHLWYNYVKLGMFQTPTALQGCTMVAAESTKTAIILCRLSLLCIATLCIPFTLKTHRPISTVHAVAGTGLVLANAN